METETLDRKSIDAAGRLLAADIPWHRYADEEVLAAFTAANEWRERHLGAMRSMHLQLAAIVRGLDLQGVTASRLKRMLSIRRKLRRIRVPLSKIQDLGGCRVILPSVREVEKFSQALQGTGRHPIRKIDDYIAAPKRDGYRSLHIKLDYGDPRHPEYGGLRLEVQARSHLQHAWATAVEAIGLYTGQNIKGGEGSAQWRRLLLLIAAEFAEHEGCAEVPDTPGLRQRRFEIKHLDEGLQATALLGRLSDSFRYIDDLIIDPEAKFLLIRYDHAAKSVEVQTFREEPEGAHVYNETEKGSQGVQLDAEPNVDAVLVSLHKLKDLKAAFPNYFGDVRLFRAQLEHICRGRGVAEYDIPRQALVPPRPHVQPDDTWLRSPRFPKPKGSS